MTLLKSRGKAADGSITPSASRTVSYPGTPKTPKSVPKSRSARGKKVMDADIDEQVDDDDEIQLSPVTNRKRARTAKAESEETDFSDKVAKKIKSEDDDEYVEENEGINVTPRRGARARSGLDGLDNEFI